MNKSIAIYNNFPSWFRNSLKYGYSLIPLRVRLGKRFFRQLEFLEKSQWWSKQELENYQNEQLQKLILHSYGNVPYYNQLFKQLKLTTRDIHTVGELYKLPVLTKEVVRNNTALLRAVNFKDKDVVRNFTGGSTGESVCFYYDKNKDYLNFDPFVWRFFGWTGHQVGELRAAFSRWLTQPNEVYTFNPVRNVLGMSTYKLNQERILDFAKALRHFPVQYFDGYPSCITLLTTFLEEKGIMPPARLKAIFSHSEPLYTWQREKLEKYWGCRCFDWYGLEERVIMGVECERHEGLHLCSDYGITEFIGNGDGFKHIIATSLTNYAFPLIRYDTEDIGEYLSQECSCNRGFPLFSLKGGRRKGFVVTKDKAYVSITTLDIASISPYVRQFQYIQEEAGRLLVNIVRKQGFEKSDTDNINLLLSKRFNNCMDFSIRLVDKVEQTVSGKTPILIQRIKEL